MGLQGGSHIVEALHRDVVEASNRASDQPEFPTEVDGVDRWLRSIGLPVGLDDQLGYVGADQLGERAEAFDGHAFADRDPRGRLELGLARADR